MRTPLRLAFHTVIVLLSIRRGNTSGAPLSRAIRVLGQMAERLTRETFSIGDCNW